MFTKVERSVACLKGLATGDAIGKQTETLKRSAVRQWYPDGVTGFHGKLGAVIPRFIGKRYEWRIAEIGGDTDSVASIGGALAAAMFPDTANEGWHQAVESVNSHNLVEVATKLAALRQ